MYGLATWGMNWFLWVESRTQMAKLQPKSRPTWADVKRNLAGFDRAALLSLVQDLYAAHKDDQAFLHSRFGLCEDALEPYKKTMDRWLWPNVSRRQETSVAKAKQAVSDYKRALGDAEGLAELMVFYCERAAGFSRDVSHDDAAYFDALVRMFEQALKTTTTLTANVRSRLLARLDRVRSMSHEFGYGVGDDMDVLLSEFGLGFRLDRLHQRGYISDPATKAKSVLLTEKGAKRSQVLFEKHFMK